MSLGVPLGNKIDVTECEAETVGIAAAKIPKINILASIDIAQMPFNPSFIRHEIT